MKRIYPLIFILPWVLWLAGCGETRSDIIEKVIFSDDDQWLERDTSEDPYELVEGRCCNDYYPYLLPMDIQIEAIIKPAGDLDYFDIQLSESYAGQLFLRSERDNITLRIFSRDMEEYEFYLDTLSYPQAVVEGIGPVYWTTLYGPLDSLTVLVKGESGKAQGEYTLAWTPVIPVTYLRVERPIFGDRWRRDNRYTIRWQYQGAASSAIFSVALLKGPVVVDVLMRNIILSNQLQWDPSDDLDPGEDYRIMVYLSKDPTTLDLSDEFEIE
ncbi:MAG: Ser-Thr-rich GPI-anchored membrane family protein [Candidatus Neomarinimicrobiota bacterium]